MIDASHPIDDGFLTATNIFVWLRFGATAAEKRVWIIFQSEIHSVYEDAMLLEVDSRWELAALGDRLASMGYVGGENLTGALNRLFTWWLPSEYD